MSDQFSRDRNNSVLSIILIPIFLILITAAQSPVSAEMKQLSEIQNGLFHINPADMVFTAKTFINDRFIDKDQSDDFIAAAASQPFLPADKNYEFSVIDHYALSSDLIILYQYDSIACCPYPLKAYLSRNDILLADYTNQGPPPTVYMNTITGREPYHNERVTAIYWRLHNFELTRDEFIHITPAGDIGYVIDSYVKIASADIKVWVGKTYPLCPEDESAYCRSCLPKSDWPKPKRPLYLIRISSDIPCVGEPFLPEPPARSCLAGQRPERTTPAATNWSYNYHLNANSINSDYYSSTSDSSSNYNSSSSNYCPTCK